MTRHNPHDRTREQYSSYYQGRPSSYPPDEFAPPSRSARVASYERMAPPQNVARVYPHPPRRRLRPQRSRNVLIAGSGVLALAALVVNPGSQHQKNALETTSSNVVCEEKVQAESVLSRSELSQLLAIAERAPKEDVRAIIDEPFCTLPSVQVREGAMSDREAYPLEFNPQTWFIVLYEEGEYAGFDFSFHRD